MKIESAELAFASQHQSVIRRQSEESLRFWRGNQRPDFEGGGPGIPSSATGVSISPAARANLAVEQAAAPARSSAIEDAATDPVSEDPRLSLLLTIIEMLTGVAVKVFNPGDLTATDPAPAHSIADGSLPPVPAATATRAGYGLEYEYRARVEEVESTVFAAQGIVRTADGQEIRFSLSLSMHRQYREETGIRLVAGDAVRKDPLVVNFNGSAAQLSDQRFAFDLDRDGRTEQLAMLASGSGYLAFDRNDNGRIDNGAELFGPASNSGFGELAALDDDSNGWIDENDAAFGALRIWTPTEDGSGTLQRLGERGIGALAAAQVATPFELRGSGNRELGGIVASGIYLADEGTAGTLQEIDLSI